MFIQIILIDKNEYSNYGVTPEFIENEKIALVVPFEDSEAIYQSMLSMINDELLKNKLIENRKGSLKMFELKKMINKLENLYLD